MERHAAVVARLPAVGGAVANSDVDDRSLSRRRPGQWQAFPRRRQGREDPLEAEKGRRAPFPVAVPDTLLGFGCMIKDSARFADGGGWGYAQFDYDAASDTFAPNTTIQETTPNAASPATRS